MKIFIEGVCIGTMVCVPGEHLGMSVVEMLIVSFAASILHANAMYRN